MFLPFIIGARWPVLWLMIIYVLYLSFGAAVFVAIEQAHETAVRNSFLEDAAEARRAVQILLSYNFTKEEIASAFRRENSLMNGEDEETIDLSWSQIYADKVFFALILISTIGYGNVAPKSDVARFVCIVYTLFGVPFNVIMLRMLGYKFRGGLRWLAKMARALHRSSKWTLVPAGVVFYGFWLSVFLFIPSIVFMMEEGWTYSLGIYYSFISVATIGLGDYVAASSLEHAKDPNFALYETAMFVWLVFGLAFMGWTLNLFSSVFGKFILDKLDCSCFRKTPESEGLTEILAAVTELNWLVTKLTPEGFNKQEEIEKFRNICYDKPEDVTPEMMKNMFDIAYELKSKAYVQMAEFHQRALRLSPELEAIAGASNNPDESADTESAKSSQSTEKRESSANYSNPRISDLNDSERAKKQVSNFLRGIVKGAIAKISEHTDESTYSKSSTDFVP